MVVVKTDSKVACYHCGEDCPDNSVHIDDKYFCCTGCKFVYELLSESGLDNYYTYDKIPGIKTAGKIDSSKFAVLDNPDIQKKVLSFSDGETARVTLTLPQIHCSACIWLLENINRLHPGITQSRVNFFKREVSFVFKEQKISLRQLVELLTSIGYEPLLSLQTIEKPSIKPSRGKLYLRIGIAGFCFANIMLLSFPEYLDSDGVITSDFRQFFGLMNIALALPVLLFSALPYYRSAYRGLKQKIINMDVPITLGIFILFSRSLYEIVSQTGVGYMDSFTGLVFFLLLGKLFQQKTYDSLSFDRDYRSYFPLSINRIIDNKTESTAITEIQTGDLISVRNNELIPADGILMDGEAHIDYSFVTGESEPVTIPRGKTIYAGGRQIGASITVEVTKPVSHSYITQLWNDATFKAPKIESLVSLSNRFSKVFTFSVLSVAMFTFLYWYFADPSKAVNAATAVLIIACPCALALSTPFTLGSAQRILGKNGLYIKSSLVIEKIARIKQLIFDKTGTLTQAKGTEIRFEGEPLTDNEMQLVASLVAHSTHPLSRKLFTKIGISELLPVDKFKEEQGRGLTGTVDGKHIRVGSASWCGTVPVKKETTDDFSSQVYIAINNSFRGLFAISGHYRSGLESVVSSIKEDYKMTILSGDNELERGRLEEIFEQSSRYMFNQSPQDKLEYIKKVDSVEQPVMMFGDGLNDAGALKQATVGIAVTEDTTSFTPASDAILDAGSFSLLDRFLPFTKKSITIIYISFAISILYNVVGLSFAVQSMLSPLIAAILMPLSSISVVLFTTITTRLAAKRIGLKV